MVPTEVDTPEARAERAALALVDQAHNAEAEDAAVVAAGDEAERAVAAEIAEPAPMSPTPESAPMVPPHVYVRLENSMSEFVSITQIRKMCLDPCRMSCKCNTIEMRE